LTINSILIVILSTMIAIIATFFLRQESAKLHLDAELTLEANLIESLIIKRLSPTKINRIQSKISNVTMTHTLDDNSQDAVLRALSHRSQFQIWDLTTKQLILHSSNAPEIPMTSSNGYHSMYYDTSLWRAYTVTLPKLNYKIITLQRHDRQIRYEKQFISDTLFVLLLSFSFLIFSLSLIISQSLSVLDETKAQLEKRKPDNLNPIDTSNIPLEVKPLIEEINRLMGQLKQTLQREQTFAANAAHELKTPLSAMKAQIQVALLQSPKEQAKSFQSVESSIERYDHIIRQLLTLSRTISASVLEPPKPIALVPIIQNTIASLVPLALKKQISLELQQDIYPVMNIHETLISTALQNLIDNSIKYSQANGSILIHLHQIDHWIRIDVIDHGPGIPDEDKIIAIQRFKRLDNAASGSGLGLSIISEICNQLDGKLSLSNTKGGGLTASIAIPLYEPTTSS